MVRISIYPYMKADRKVIKVVIPMLAINAEDLDKLEEELKQIVEKYEAKDDEHEEGGEKDGRISH